MLDEIRDMIHELQLRDVEFTFLSRTVSYARDSKMVFIGVENLKVLSELLNCFRRVRFKLSNIDEVQKGSKSLHDARRYLRVVSDDGDETCFKLPMLATGVLTERRKAIREVSMLDMFLQALVPTIHFLIADKFSRPLHDMFPKKFVPLVQGVGRKKFGGIRKLPIVPEWFNHAIHTNLPCSTIVLSDVRGFHLHLQLPYSEQCANTGSGGHLHAGCQNC